MATVRIQIDLDEQRVKQLEEVMRLCDIPTKRELFNNALTLLSWAVDNVLNGRTIASVDKKKKSFSDLEMPALRAAAAHREEPLRATSGF